MLKLYMVMAGILLAGAAASAPGNPVPQTLPFGPGEVSTFAIKYGVVRAGTATLSVLDATHLNGELVYHLESRAKSSRFFSTFFKVDDRVESWWAPQARLPREFRKSLREGKYAKDEFVRFEHDLGKAIYDNADTAMIVAGAQDILSAFYAVRAAPNLQPGVVVILPSHADRENHSLNITVLRRETIEVPAGTFRCLVVEPMLKTAGLFKQEGTLTIWLTDDARRMPVLMRSKVAVGAIEARLEAYRPPRRGGSRGP